MGAAIVLAARYHLNVPAVLVAVLVGIPGSYLSYAAISDARRARAEDNVSCASLTAVVDGLAVRLRSEDEAEKLRLSDPIRCLSAGRRPNHRCTQLGSLAWQASGRNGTCKPLIGAGRLIRGHGRAAAVNALRPIPGPRWPAPKGRRGRSHVRREAGTRARRPFTGSRHRLLDMRLAGW
jgi:hypothetical protein